jgi:ribosomal protein L11 methyltransferase
VHYPALDVAGPDDELLLAAVDDCLPLALEERAGALTLFFSTSADRERAEQAILIAFPDATIRSRDVDDEDWARRSQQSLQPVTVGRITIAPPWAIAPSPQPLASSLQPLLVIIEPSMGFGTGHHATTRLCLAALQTLDLDGAFVVDVGTGSGVLAMTARLLGAREAVGIDMDPDAIGSARENLTRNPGLTGVVFEIAELTEWLCSPGRSTADVIAANLTGALLVRSAGVLIDAVRVGGHLIVSGLMQSERIEVAAAFARRTEAVSTTSEEEWVELVLRRTS